MLNKVELIGRLGADPESRFMPTGGQVVNLSLATTRRWKNRETGERQEETEWHRVVVFGKLANICSEYLKKGALIYIEGRIRTRKWQDNSGQDRYSTEIIAENMLMLGSRAESQVNQSAARSNLPPSANPNVPPLGSGRDNFDDDIPF